MPEARLLLPDGTYERVKPKAGEPRINSQAYLLSRHSARPTSTIPSSLVEALPEEVGKPAAE